MSEVHWMIDYDLALASAADKLVLLDFFDPN